MAEACAASPDAGFRVHSAVRPVRRAPSPTSSCRPAGWPPACASAASGPATSVAMQLPNWMEAAATFWASALPRRGRRADRALLRPQGTRPHPRDRQAEGVHHDRGVRPDDVPAGPVRGRADRRRWSARRRAASTTCSPTSRWSARSPPIPAAPGADRLHLGHHPRSEGRRPQPPDAGLRDPPAAGELPARPRQAAHRHAGRSLHRHARRVPDPRARGRADRPCRRLGSRARCSR